MDFIDKIKIKLLGLNPAILGLRGSGKSTLLNYMQTGEILKHYAPTNSEMLTRKTIIFNTKSPIKLRKNVKDLGGSEDFYDRWREQIQKAQLIIYMIDSEQWLSPSQDEIANKIEKDLQVISQSLDTKKGVFSTILLINKFDLIKDKFDFTDYQLKEKLQQINFIQGCKLTLTKPSHPCKVLISNLDTSENANQLVNEIAEVIT
ncbi:MAG: GTPase domain-containing protein [Acinetobacter sp.]|uniref:GTPase domain-containing protein n=1 Tax=Acinetobacter sp. TaxID=472 RepID=UPI0026DB9C05|nr:GTPase domain-containing protein [Acinetobacter sp.]MDO4579165.1 GTPase domain-containing protein [Acinetobacter sp.]